jgi:hypothetical protein
MLSLLTPFGTDDETVVYYNERHEKNIVLTQNQSKMWAEKKAEATAMLEKLLARKFENKC